MLILKKVLSILMVVILTIGFTTILVTPVAAANTSEISIKFTDSSLEAYIRIIIKKPSGTITSSDIKGIEVLNLFGSGVTNLEDLRYFTNLKEFYFSEAKVMDLKPLVNLKKLTKLYLSYSTITDITPLAGIVNLIELDLKNTKIKNLVPLKNLTNLQSLNLGTTPVSDLTPLNKLTKLTKLILTNTNVSNINTLKNLTNLTELKLRGSLVKDFSPTAGYYNNLKEPDFARPKTDQVLVWGTPPGFKSITNYNYDKDGFFKGWTFTNYFKYQGNSDDISIKAHIKRSLSGTTVEWSNVEKKEKLLIGKYYKVTVDVNYDYHYANYTGEYDLELYYGDHLFESGNPVYSFDSSESGKMTANIGREIKIKIEEIKNIPSTPIKK